MGRWGFIKGRGKDLAPSLTPEVLQNELQRLGLHDPGLDIRIAGDIVHLSGPVPSQDDKERIILAVGNVRGVAAVIEDIPSKADPSFYTIVPGDTLRSVAATWLGCAERWHDILAANRPMLSASDLIYRGQVLRLPRN